MKVEYNPHPGAQTELMSADSEPVVRVFSGFRDPDKALRLKDELIAAGYVVATVYQRSTAQMYFDEADKVLNLTRVAVLTDEPSEKRKQLIAQLNRAKAQRNKNLVRDLTRQLEVTA